ncbi:chaperone protein [Mycoplasmopsis maculosa]|uniref:Chaperone protein DnaJ n=1 Tax=Mycoplasmopsis maculosa TaxID=114885 RepID=A0A449B4Q1_9BACT|nr:DnaJ C-terminal domain-containing protein [Mycoplasmopsis maculosa]VEU75546.1 chaperone protein [Mycoplasmopsis maculosa]
MDNNKDYYAILGVSKNATEKEIKMAYRKLAMQYHPDKVKDGSSDEKMQKINEAYDILSDPKKREHYDRYGADGPQAGGFSGASGFDFGSFNMDFGDIFGDIFSNFGFGGGSRSRSKQANQKMKGEDILSQISISFTDAILGKKISEKLKKFELCETCKGHGALEKDIKTCSKCQGSGRMRVRQRTPFGITEVLTTCDLCNGKGKEIANKCLTCNGEGYNEKLKNVAFYIPAGADNKTQIKLDGYGKKGINGGPSGDMYVNVIVNEHKFYKRSNLDLFIEVSVSFLDIIRENTIKVPTPYGPEELKLKRNYQNGKVITLKNKGIKTNKDSRVGDLHVKLNLQMPNFDEKVYKKMVSDLETYLDTTNADFISQVEKEK